MIFRPSYCGREADGDNGKQDRENPRRPTVAGKSTGSNRRLQLAAENASENRNPRKNESTGSWLMNEIERWRRIGQGEPAAP
jgi:hypothetical protein